MCLRLDAEGEILAHGDGGFEVLLALLAHELSPKMRWPGNVQTETGRQTQLVKIGHVRRRLDSIGAGGENC